LVVDDSAFMRQVLIRVLADDPQLAVVGVADDGLSAAQQLEALDPDVITLDVTMPGLDGLTLLGRLMQARPTPVIMVSSLTEAGCEITLRALELGAVDFVAKPRRDRGDRWEDFAKEVRSKVRMAARARLRVRRAPTGDGARPGPKPLAKHAGGDIVVVLGASTGGPEALREIVTALPPGAPAILVAQHMPAMFTRAFAARLDKLASVRVKEAEDGDPLIPGQVLIAPGDQHLRVQRQGSAMCARLSSEAPVNRHRPSVDVLFQAAATVVGKRGIGGLLTGMGQDGAGGLLAMRQAGARTFAQAAETCVVPGMPSAAVAMGAAERVLSLDRIAQALMVWASAAAPGPMSYA
jgi:two-component system chemotaxis response regulator CheB